MATRTKLIGTITTLTITSILLWIAFNQNFILNASGDITCAGTPYYDTNFKKDISDCQVFWNVTSINYTYYFRNKKGIELGFSPEVKGYEMFVKDGRYKTGWRSLDKSGNFTYRKGIKYQFMAFVFKDFNQTVKWKITAAEQIIDPVLFGIDIQTLQDCNINTQPVNNPIYATCYRNSSYIYINNITKTNNEIFVSYPYSCQVASYFSYINITICETYGYNISGRAINWKKGQRKCYFNFPFITCKVQHQSNINNPNCLSGERCEIIDVRNMAVQLIGVAETKQIESIKIQ